ncbi:MAG: helix-turn-helix domain-containing protein [Bacteroidia bacterium]
MCESIIVSMDIGQRIKQKRLEKNYTQEYVATRLGISQNAYSRIETGLTQLKTERLNTLASILETPVDNFISKSLENVKQISVENTIYDYNHILSTKNLIERYEQRLQELIKLNEKTLILIEKLNNNK